MFLKRLAGDRGSTGVFANGSEKVVELDRRQVAKAGLEAEVAGGCGHRKGVMVVIFRVSRGSVTEYRG
jgi:hypothetical protein